ncbi:HAMP domain-containing sensor histidine kinase [Proteiniborus sp. MB09-C3]|uniref:sensor histidine kinase n=1 Tax=Proteiniborus sp. MB09-C3 TaxID=3050072 RepID=UPI002554B3E3|nr:HAMP domain-containing sensor histidine kinase [Proteiniborus sp. MB09-C3]WIV13401.1 HAMP domain-containing sensor histidine kinase [Proteiniborus sp. MB09-C3]
MITYILLLLILLCIIQFAYTRNLKKQAVEWLEDLKEIRSNPQQKIFTKKSGIFADITFELNSILKENRKQLLLLEKSDIANKQILTNLSHDVRTPLASLIGYLEALDNNSADDTREYIQISYKKALALKSLIDVLFEWCKISSNEQQYQMDYYDINELTREFIIDWLPLLEKKKISFHVNIPDNEWLVLIDKAAYKRIINNLIQNAIYHGECSNIAIHIEKNEDKIITAVFNNGYTIPEDKLPYIFDRLYKCDISRSDTGTGLGLSITKELIAAMKGTISVESAAETGTTFTIIFS